jgi:hypothetical protein
LVQICASAGRPYDVRRYLFTYLCLLGELLRRISLRSLKPPVWVRDPKGGAGYAL